MSQLPPARGLNNNQKFKRFKTQKRLLMREGFMGLKYDQNLNPETHVYSRWNWRY
jgi:hypothetical protein